MRHRAKPALALAAAVAFAPLAAWAQAGAAPDPTILQPAAAPAPPGAPVSPAEPLDRVNQVPLFSAWAWRQKLEGKGVTLLADFIAEPAVNAVGYKGSGWVYAQEVDFGAVFDLDKMGWSDDGAVKVLFSDRVGETVQRYTGAYIQDQPYWGQGQNFRLDEMSYMHSFLGDRLSLKAGFYSMGDDFGGLSYVCDYNNNGNCGHPLGLLYDSGWLDSPTGNWGGRLKWTDASGFYIESGVYDVTPMRKDPAEGFDLGFGHTTGVIVPVEFGYVLGDAPADYPGTYKIGFYYDSSVANDLEAPTRTVRGREGGYIQFAQQIWKAHPGEIQGVSVFGVATYGDPQTGLFSSSYEAGATWRGLIPWRKDDYASVSWVQLNVNSAVERLQALADKPVQTDEQLFELNYGIQAAPWLLVRPALQYVARPGAYSSRPDSFVYSMHLQATF